MKTECTQVKEYLILVNRVAIPLTIVLGFAVGLLVPANADLSPGYRSVSSVIGWTYFFAWALSYYPQIITNYTKKSSIGMASDKVLYDLIGFSSLSIYSISMYCIPSVREAYERDHYGHTPTVAINDVCYAIHALIISFIFAAQMAYFDGTKQMPTKVAMVGASILLAIIVFYLILIVSFGDKWHSICSFMNWLYFLSFVKVGITFVKYIPQALLNYHRKSTSGWNTVSTFMDFEGSILSILQLVLDCYNLHDWEGISGNIVKLALGFLSASYDILFMIQRFVLYPPDKTVYGSTTYAPLLIIHEDERSLEEETRRSIS